MATRHLIKGNEKAIHFTDLATIESNEAFSTFALHTTVVIVFLFGSRKLASWFRPSICDFLNEFIAMLAYCACFYSQGSSLSLKMYLFKISDVMLAHFGYTGLFFAIFLHMYICHSLNEGHGENMVILMDEGLKNTENDRYSSYLVSLIVPAHTATLIVYFLLLNLFDMIPTQPFCENSVLEPIVIVVIVCGFFCGAVLHAVLRRFHRDDKYHDVVSALIYAAVFTFSHAVIGIYAAHPFITLSRLLGCMKSININSWPIPFIIHMTLPFLGWIFASKMLRTPPSKYESIWQQRYDEELEDELNERIDLQQEQWNHGYNLRPRNNR
ncbi:hypothetical protein CRE_31356 [Caenorhabditis remanei]|uniref:Uncharacterized protein n=1 Tax=Caenorhabditis remanei TaxID=31234 RepID=E3MY64_CAERE|nr:hypothetical protein CRE_31356 [Caenorhabditis remanei]